MKKIFFYLNEKDLSTQELQEEWKDFNWGWENPNDLSRETYCDPTLVFFTINGEEHELRPENFGFLKKAEEIRILKNGKWYHFPKVNYPEHFWIKSIGEVSSFVSEQF